MRACDTTFLLLTSLCLLFLNSHLVLAWPLRTSQQLSDELQEYIDNSAAQYVELPYLRSRRQSRQYFSNYGKKSESMSASELLNQLFNMVRDRGEPSGKIKAMRFGISKR